MRGEGRDGRPDESVRVDALDLDVLDDPQQDVPTLGEPGDPDDGVDGNEFPGEWVDGEWVPGEWVDGEWVPGEWPPDDAQDGGQEILDEEDALYDDYDDYDDQDDVPAAPMVLRSLPSPPEAAYDDAENWDEDDDDAWDDPVPADAPWPMPTVPEPVAARTGADPAIWAPGTAPGAWVPLGRPRFGNPVPSPGDLGRTRTRRRNLSVFSLAGLTNVLLLAYGVTAALLAAFTAALARRRGALDQVSSAADRADALARSSHLVAVTTWGVVALLVATIVASMAWSGVAARNHRMLSGTDDAASPGMAVVSWVLPVVNLVLPLRAVSEVAAGPEGHRSPPAATMRWWVSWVVSMLTVGYVLYAAITTSDTDLPEAITRLTLAAVLATVCFLYCFSQASVLFRHVARLQHDLAVEND